ncbi:MAG: leucine-rich repeat protein, partial [Clostridia bacterium]|nr:leucine-rich repeat protein [Clostridia bacterium]
KATNYVSGYHMTKETNGDYTEIYLESNDEFVELWDISYEAGKDNVYAGIKVYEGDGISEDTTYVLEVGGTGRTKEYMNKTTITNSEMPQPWYENYGENIVKLDLKEGVTAYGRCLFYRLPGVTSLDLPDSLKTIGQYAFREMDGLNSSISIPSNVVEMIGNPFADTPVTEFTVETGNARFIAEQGVLYDNIGKILVAYPIGKTAQSYTVKADTKEICEYAFLREESLKEVVLPEGLEIIKGGAFEEVKALTEITIPSTVTHIDGFAFAKIPTLKNVYLKVTDASTFTLGTATNQFANIGANSIIYTESKAIADKFEVGTHYTAGRTQVYYPFAITSDLPDQELERGDTLTFAPTIEDGFISGDVIYQWYLNGNAINGANEKTYTKAGFNTPDAGEYKLVIKSAMQANGEYYYTVESNVAEVRKVDLTGPEYIGTSVEYNEDGTATVTITTTDIDSGISGIKVNGESIEITKDDATFSATGKYVVSASGAYTITAIDGANNSSRKIINAYEITYNSNAAVFTGTTARQIKIEDAPITLHANGFKKVGYTFIGWNTAADATGVKYAEGVAYSANAGLNLYAEWQINQYTVKFYSDNGVDGVKLISEKVYNYGEIVEVPGKQERIGELVDDNTYRIFYHNNAWRAEKVDASASESVANITASNIDSVKVIDSDVNYYATFASKDFSTHSGTTIINGTSEVSGTTYGIINDLGLVIIGNNSTAGSAPTISGDTASGFSIINNGGALLWHIGALHGPVQGLMAQK